MPAPLFDAARLTKVLHIDKMNWEILSTGSLIDRIHPLALQDLNRLILLSQQSKTVRLRKHGNQLHFTRDFHQHNRSVYGS